VILLAGQVPLEASKHLHHYFDAILPITYAPVSIKEATKNTRADLERTAMELGNLLALKKEK
jgi:glycerate kinase